MNSSRCIIELLEPRALLSTVTPTGEFPVGGAGDFWGAYGRTLSSDANGNFVVVQSAGAGGNCDALVRVFDRAGNPKTGWIVADDPNDAKTKFTPNVAMAANGNFVVTWRQLDNLVAARLFNAAGQPIGSIITVVRASGSLQYSATAAMDDNGNFVIVWSGQKKGQNVDILGQRYNAAGALVGKQFIANTYSNGSQGVSSVDMDADGDFLVAWASPGQDGSGSGVYGQRFRKDGVAIGGEFRVNVTTAGDQTLPSVALDAAGDAAVVWKGPAPDGTTAVWGRRYNASGVPDGEFRIDDPADGDADAPSLDMARDGSFVVGWSRYVKAFNSQGQALGPRVIAGTGSFWGIQVAAEPEGGFTAVWSRQGDLFGEEFILA